MHIWYHFKQLFILYVWKQIPVVRSILAKLISTKSLICQIIMVIKVTSFQAIFPNILLEISVSVWTPTHYEHALHVYAKYFFDNEQIASRQEALGSFQKWKGTSCNMFP